MSEPTEKRFAYGDRIQKLEKAVETLSRRAVKLGQEPLTLRLGEPTTVYTRPPSFKAYEDPQELLSQGGALTSHETVADLLAWERREVLELSVNTPKLAGWTFLGVVDHIDGLVTRYPLADEDIDLAGFEDADGTCDHCATARKRRETFIVLHQETGELKRVGRQCLADFLGHDARKLTSYLNLIGKALTELDEMSGLDEGCGLSFSTVDALEFLAHVAAMIRTHGWVSAGQARDDCRASTKEMALANQAERNPDFQVKPTQADATLAGDAQKWASHLTDDAVAGNDYLRNLRAVCIDGHVQPKRLGLVASVVSTYQRELDAQARAQASSEMGLTNEDARPVPESVLDGRQTVEGTVLSCKWKESDFGGCLKMMVAVDLPEGGFFKVYGTAPSALGDPARLSRVRFTARFSLGRDGSREIAFYSRPTKPELVAEAPESAVKAPEKAVTSRERGNGNGRGFSATDPRTNTTRTFETEEAGDGWIDGVVAEIMEG